MNNASKISPPVLVLKFLRWFCDPDLLEDVEGDLCELFEVRSRGNRTKARWLFIRDVLMLFRPGLIRNFDFLKTQNNFPMITNHIKTALRHALKYKGYTTINLLGLIVGLASSMMILLWVQDELGKDQFHAKSDRLYQLWRNMHQANGEVITTGAIPQPLEEVLENDYPEVDEVTLVGWEMTLLFRRDEKVSYEIGRYASPEFFSIFSFPFLAGNLETALKDPYSVVISRDLAEKYFGENWKAEAPGKAFKIQESQEFIVSGVFDRPGKSASVSFDFILPVQEYVQRNDWVKSWYNGGFSMFLTLREDADVDHFRQRILQEVNNNTGNEADERIYVQKFSESYLHSNFKNGVPTGGRIQYVRILFVVALFILVISCINFMNLATARASRRTKEIGIRKVLGARKQILGQQFMVESFLLTIAAVIVSLLVVFLTIPFFNEITGKSLTLDFGDPKLWVVIGGLTLITGFLSGSYPAILLPSFEIVHSLKGTKKKSGAGAYFRNGLVVFQFSLSILLIIGSIVVSQQMKYILNKNLGLDKENLVYLNMEGDLARRSDVYKTELLKIPEVKNVTFASGNPLSYGRSTGSASWEGKNPDEVVEINVLNVDVDFFEAMGIEISLGRGFSREFATDSSNFIINEVAAGIMGFSDPVGKNLSVWGQEGKVIGVVKNFHMSSLYNPIEPLIIRYDPGSTSVAFIRIEQNVQAAIEGIEKVTTALNAAYPFQYEFLDTNYEQKYRSEMALSTLVNIFAIVSVFISCLGLLGLSSFSADQRSKEIGIRKVHGASVFKLVLLLSGAYTKLMLLAFILASPIAYYYMKGWLENFTFRNDLSLMPFLVSGMLAFVVGALTVSFKSYQAASINPVRTLKEE